MKESDLATLESAALQAVSFHSDSRKVSKKSIFIALIGAKSDGHDFLDKARAQGALYCVVDEKRALQGDDLIAVEDTALAHRELARIFRERYRGHVVGIGGSNGKTSTKEFLSSLIAEKSTLLKTEKSQNGFQGIPKTLEGLSDKTGFAVVEMGTDGPGDMASHVRIVQPDSCILTSIGEEHLNLLKDLDGVFAEERVLIDHCLAKGAPAFVPESDEYLKRIEDKKSLKRVPSDLNAIVDGLEDALTLFGVARQNFALAASCALSLGVAEETILSVARKASPPEGRGQLKQSDGRLLVKDHYNANLSSMRTAIRSAKELAAQKELSLVLVLGDMLDLGDVSDEKHRELAQEVNQSEASLVIGVGREIQHTLFDCTRPKRYYPDAKTLGKEINETLPKESLVLFKASRGIGLERAIADLDH